MTRAACFDLRRLIYSCFMQLVQSCSWMDWKPLVQNTDCQYSIINNKQATAYLFIRAGSKIKGFVEHYPLFLSLVIYMMNLYCESIRRQASSSNSLTRHQPLKGPVTLTACMFTCFPIWPEEADYIIDFHNLTIISTLEFIHFYFCYWKS